MTEVSPGLGLPYLQPSQAQKHVTHNAALQLLDQLVQLRITTFDAMTPPPLPVAGETHALAVGATGAWVGQEGMLALWETAGWRFLAPQEGWLSWDLGTARLRSWSAAMGWTPVQLDQLDMLGIGTPADASNRLSVSAPATLLSHDGGGHQLKINKAADGETASLLLQSNWLGHAELGLVGDTIFVLKVSADGTSWTEVMRADPLAQKIDWATTGSVQMSLTDSALQLDVPLTGSAVQSGAGDTTVGRLMLNGGHGLGGVSLALTDAAPTDNSISTGFYRFNGATVPGGPESLGDTHLIHLRRDTGGGEFQLAVNEATQGMYYRTRVTGGWRGWKRLDTETGSNANGAYVRFGDGTQICTAEMEMSYAAAASMSKGWTYPSAFVVGSKPVFAAHLDAGDFATNVASAQINDCGPIGFDAVSNSYALAQLYRGSGAADFVTGDTSKLYLTATGRWF